MCTYKKFPEENQLLSTSNAQCRTHTEACMLKTTQLESIDNEHSGTQTQMLASLNNTDAANLGRMRENLASCCLFICSPYLY